MADFHERAGEVFGGRHCAVCDHEIEADQPVRYDVDSGGDDGSRFVVTVWCVRCWEVVGDPLRNAFDEALNATVGRRELWLTKANLSRLLRDDLMADFYMFLWMQAPATRELPTLKAAS